MESMKNEGIEQASEQMAQALEKAENPADFARKIDGIVANFSEAHLKDSPAMVDKVKAAAKQAKKLIEAQWDNLKTKESRTAEKTISIISETFGISPGKK